MAQALTERHLVTADELLRMPNLGVRRELIRGELREMAAPGEEHADVATELARSLGNHVRARDLGRVYSELGYRVSADPDTVLIPDVSFVRAERVPAGRRNPGYRLGVPDVAVEVVSPHDSLDEVEEKVFEWLTSGCAMVIVVNPRRQTATVYRSFKQVMVLNRDEVLDCGDLVPGWTLRLADLFDGTVP
jgi:Uma2 family endonuclease